MFSKKILLGTTNEYLKLHIFTHRTKYIFSISNSGPAICYCWKNIRNAPS